MPSERTGYAPWSLTREAGVQSATVDGTIKVPQNIQPVLSTGFVDEKGDWKGVKSSDETFKIDATHAAIPNGGVVVSPQAQPDFIDMRGFNDLFVAFKVTEGGGSGFQIVAVMGPDTNTFANLTPVNAASYLRGNAAQAAPDDFENIFEEGAQTMVQDAWNIFSINGILRNWTNLQFRITNNTGATSDIEFAYMRLV